MSQSAPPPDAADERSEVWSRYWSQLARGRGAAAAGSFSGGYAGTVIERWWRSCIGALNGHRRWLDVATGNGAVPLVWSQVNTDPDARCDAVDLARIEAPWTASLDAAKARRIVWHAGVSAEALPFDATSIDVAMSQYGFEYARRGEAIAELVRVLVPGGALRLVMHHAGGRPARLARVEVGHIDDLLGSGGLWTLAQRLIEPFSRSGTAAGRAMLAADSTMETLRQTFNEAQDRLNAMARVSLCPDVLRETTNAVASVLQRAASDGTVPAQALVQRWTQNLHDSRLRLVELQSHALDEAASADLRRRLEATFIDIVLDTVQEQGHLMGWALSATRR